MIFPNTKAIQPKLTKKVFAWLGPAKYIVAPFRGFQSTFAKKLSSLRIEHSVSLSLGSLGERVAAGALEAKGMRLLHRNWRTKIGEIDLIFWDRGELVFVEVKSRYAYKDANFIIFQNIHRKKRRKLRNLAQLYLIQHFSAASRPPHRIDVVGVVIERLTKRPLSVEHLISVL